MGRLALLASTVLGALALAALAFLLSPPAISVTAAVAVYAASLATAGFVINGRQAIVDRGDLQAEITVEHMGEPLPDDGSAVILVRLFNAGRRPVRVEDVGLWSDQSRMSRFPYWESWEDSTKRVDIPKTFGEEDSLRIWAWPSCIAGWYVKHHQPHWLSAKLAHGDPLWVPLPPDVQRHHCRLAASAGAVRVREGEGRCPGRRRRRGPAHRPQGQRLGDARPACRSDDLRIAIVFLMVVKPGLGGWVRTLAAGPVGCGSARPSCGADRSLRTTEEPGRLARISQRGFKLGTSSQPSARPM